MTKKILIVFMMVVTFLSCHQNKKTDSQEIASADSVAYITVKGQLVMGHEGEVFTPCGSKDAFWVEDTTDKLKSQYEEFTKDAKEHYTPIYAELKVVDKGKTTEGFAAEYDGVYEVIEVISVRPLNETDCKSEETNSRQQVISQEFISKDGKSLSAVYNTNGEKPTVTITYDTYKDQVLPQTTAWAKGAEYENEAMKWTTKPDGGELTINGKTITFKPQK